MRYFLELRYNGGAYFGWQRQPAMPTVQQTLEQALATLLREPVEVTGAGRTDTGVNASYYVAHFDVSQPVAGPPSGVMYFTSQYPGCPGITPPRSAGARNAASQSANRSSSTITISFILFVG